MRSCIRIIRLTHIPPKNPARAAVTLNAVCQSIKFPTALSTSCALADSSVTAPVHAPQCYPTFLWQPQYNQLLPSHYKTSAIYAVLRPSEMPSISPLLHVLRPGVKTKCTASAVRGVCERHHYPINNEPLPYLSHHLA